MGQNLSYYLSFYRSRKQHIALSLFLSLIQALSLFPLALIIQYLFDVVLKKKDVEMLAICLLSAILLIVLNSFFTLLNRAVALKMIKSIVAEIREKLLYQILFLNTAYHTQEDLDKVHNQIVQDTERLDNMTAALLTQLLPGAFIVIALSTVLMYMNPFLFFILLLILPVLFFLGKLIGKKLKKSVKEFHNEFTLFSKGISFVLKFNELIKISSAEKKEQETQITNIKKLEVSSRKVAWLASTYNTVQGNLFVVGAIIVLLFGGLQVINGNETLGSLISFYVLLNIISSYLKTMVGVVPSLIEGNTSLNTLIPILQNENKENSSTETAVFTESVVLENVDFTYDMTPVLKDISVEIKKHQVLGVFGPSGSGKSTLIKLILGVYPPQRGRILIDRRDIKELNIFEYRRKIGVLPQEPLFFPGTIRENLTYGIENLDNDIIVEMCKKCRIHDFIISLPQGYDTEIGNSGKKISGGQKQRIAIARALLRNPEILILDEPDNNLDEVTIFEIMENIKALKVTTIVISHNAYITKFANQTLHLS